MTAWLRQHALPIKTTKRSSDVDDLQAFKPLMSSARIVALGEATQGAHEFFELRQRLTEFLVKEMGFTIIALEANWAEVNRINAYAQDASALHALTGLGWRWNTRELTGVATWALIYNSQTVATSRVQFAGFDAPSAVVAMDVVQAYAQRVDAATALRAGTRRAGRGGCHLHRRLAGRD
jgi:erythromycin esterase